MVRIPPLRRAAPLRSAISWAKHIPTSISATEARRVRAKAVIKARLAPLLVPPAHADGHHRGPAHGEHGGDGHHRGDERDSQIHCPQGRGPHALAHEDAVHHVVEIGHAQSARGREDVPAQDLSVHIQKDTSKRKKKWDKPDTGSSHFNGRPAASPLTSKSIVAQDIAKSTGRFR